MGAAALAMLVLSFFSFGGVAVLAGALFAIFYRGPGWRSYAFWTGLAGIVLIAMGIAIMIGFEQTVPAG